MQCSATRYTCLCCLVLCFHSRSCQLSSLLNQLCLELCLLLDSCCSRSSSFRLNLLSTQHGTAQHRLHNKYTAPPTPYMPAGLAKHATSYEGVCVCDLLSHAAQWLDMRLFDMHSAANQTTRVPL